MCVSVECVSVGRGSVAGTVGVVWTPQHVDPIMV